MKSIISALSVLFVLFFIGCSNLEQETSPVAPELQKSSTKPATQNGTYNYLQCFDFIPVQSFKSTQNVGSIEITIAQENFPKVFKHMFAVLEYDNSNEPVTNKMLFIDKPRTNIFELNNVFTKELKNVKVYAYIPGNDIHGITPPYPYLTSFGELKISNWNVSDEGIEIYTDDWNQGIGDSFVELSVLNEDYRDFVLTYIAKPTNGKFVLPKIVKGTISEVKMYGFINYDIFQ